MSRRHPTARDRYRIDIENLDGTTAVELHATLLVASNRAQYLVLSNTAARATVVDTVAAMTIHRYCEGADRARIDAEHFADECRRMNAIGRNVDW